jgi:predicted RecB family nuclease
MNTIITAYTLRHLTTCERRIWLDAHGDPDQREEVFSPSAFAGRSHEAAVQAAMFGPAEPIQVANWAERVKITRRLMQEGASGIQGAAFERPLNEDSSVVVRGAVDWLRRVSQPSNFGRWAYEPVEIKLHRKPEEPDRLQLDLYLWLLTGEQGVAPSGWLWLGRDTDNRPEREIEHSLRADRLSAAFEQITTILAGDERPIYLASHCELCPWHTFCKGKAASSQAVSLLPGVNRSTWEHFNREGIHTVEHVLARTPKELEKFKGLGKAKARDLHTYAQAFANRQHICRNPIPAEARPTGIMFDLETTIDGAAIGIPWCFGWMEPDGRMLTAVVDAVNDGKNLRLTDGNEIIIIRDSDDGWRMVAESARRYPGPVYHWGSFEMGVLRANAPEDVVKMLESRLHDLNRTFRKTYALPVRGTSIKVVANYLDFKWPNGTNAFTCWADYKAWLEENDRHKLTRAIAYNRADVEALQIIHQWMLEKENLTP